jgi:ubiquinone biosynthesis monooxygenase Coq7
MRDQEQHHLNTFENLIVERRVRPTALSPIWNVGAYALGTELVQSIF